jgi:hypothetical protein
MGYIDIVELTNDGVTTTPLGKVSRDIEQELWSALKTGNFQVTSAGSKYKDYDGVCCVCNKDFTYLSITQYKGTDIACQPCRVEYARNLIKKGN